MTSNVSASSIGRAAMREFARAYHVWTGDAITAALADAPKVNEASLWELPSGRVRLVDRLIRPRYQSWSQWLLGRPAYWEVTCEYYIDPEPPNSGAEAVIGPEGPAPGNPGPIGPHHL